MAGNDRFYSQEIVLCQSCMKFWLVASFQLYGKIFDDPWLLNHIEFPTLPSVTACELIKDFFTFVARRRPSF